MFTTADKVSKHVTAVQRQSAQPFFARKSAHSFFGSNDKSSTVTSFIQPKLSVSHPEDPQEKEADQMANRVMTMPETKHVSASSEQNDELNPKEEEQEIQRIEMPSLQMMEESEELQRMEEEEEVQQKEDSESTLQREEEQKEEKIQTKLFSGNKNINPNHFVQTKCEGCDDKKLDRKVSSVPPSYTVQRFSRGPPGALNHESSFEQNLQASRGTGNPLPGETRSFMESRFSADFSGVRVHTHETSVQMNKEIHAQAFTYGNDIYFNSGKYAPSCTEGKTLLAHELTHTIQQGASAHVTAAAKGNNTAVSPKLISRKRIIQRSAANLASAVNFARAEQGKVIANKEGPDGLRFGWKQLMEYFKTTLGAEKILPDGVAGDATTVPESNIKKKNIAKGVNIITPDGQLAKGERDAMPSWCGIFAFWALNKAGFPLKKWLLGRMTIPPEAAHPPGSAPPPGYIAYRNLRSHYGLVSSSDGSKVTTVNGNTAGDDHLGGEIQEQTHDLSSWTAFIDPMKLTEGAVRNPEAGVEEKPKSFREMQKELFGTQRKEEEGTERDGTESKEKIQTRKENSASLSPSDTIGESNGNLSEELQRQEEGKDDEKTIHKKELIHTAADNAAEEEKEELQRKEEPNEEDNVVQKKEMVLGATNNSPPFISLLQRQEKLKEDGIVQKKEIIHLAADSSPPESEEIQRKEELKEEDPSVQKKDLILSASDSSPPGEAGEKSIVQRKSEPKVQRLFGWVSDVADWVGDKLEDGKKWVLEKVKNLIIKVPGYKALRVVLGRDPITDEKVARNGYNFIDAAIDIMPLGDLLKQKLQELGILDQAAKLVEKLFGRVETLISGIYGVFADFIDSLSLSDLKNVSAVFSRLENAFTTFFDLIKNFAKGVANDFFEFIKRALLIPLGNFIKTKTKFWDLLCLIIGKDPLTDEVKNPTGANILNAILGLSEWGQEQKKKMQETGTFNKVAAWIDKGISVFSKAYDMLKAAFKGLWNIVSIEALMHPIDTFLKIFDSFYQPIALVGKFFVEAGIAILKIVKDVLFKWISEKGKQTKGYYLVTVLISKDPFTGEKVPRTTENLIKGFMLLSEGGEEQFNKMKESGAIDRATAKIDAAVATLGFTWAYVKGLFISLWESFTWKDLLLPVLAFAKILGTFKNPILRLISFIITVVVALFEVILRMMGFPVDLVFKLIDNVKKAWKSIKADPAGFIMNLLRAIKQGFIQFFDNILTHLWEGLKAWLRMELEDAGIPMPTDYTAMGIIKWLLVVLDITMEKIWKKLEARIGKEKVDKIRGLIAKAEAIYDKANEAMAFIEDVRQRGMDAIVDKIKEKLSDIWNMVLNAIQSFLMDQIIKKVTAKLLSMLDPTGIMAVINSAIALYKAIQSFFKYLARILEIVNSFVEGIIEICMGNITTAANFLERSLANGIPIVIGFLANQVGLDLSGSIREILATVREKVDQGLDFLIDKLVGFVEFLVAKLKQAKDAVLGWLGLKKPLKDSKGGDHEIYFEGSESSAKLYVASYNPKTITTLLNAVGKIIDKPNNIAHAEKYNTSVKVNGEIDAIKIKLADKSNPNAENDNKEMIQKLDLLAANLPPLMTMVGGTEPPPLVKPGFANGVKASGFEVHYLKKGRTGGGSAANANSGATLAGWPKINQAGLSAKSAWVKMHLLTEQLGGPALDSNLTPARGPEINSLFYRKLEKHAIEAVANDKVIWYKTSVEYHGTPNENYASSIGMEWGPYVMNESNEQWEKKPKNTVVDGTNVGGDLSRTTAPPDFSGALTIPNINDPAVGRVKIENIATGLNRPFAEFVIQVRDNGSFNDANAMETRLMNAHKKRKIKIENFLLQVATLKSAVNNTYTIQNI